MNSIARSIGSLAAALAIGVLSSCGSERSRTERSAGDAQAHAAVEPDKQRPGPCKLDLAPIGGGRLGVLSVGMTIEELRAACPGATLISGVDEEGAPRTICALPVTERDTVFAALDTLRGRSSVRWFSISFAGPRTDDGIGVGSVYRTIKAQYRQLQTDDNEGTVYVWPEPDRGVSFALGVKLDRLNPAWRRTPGVIPDTAHVTELLIRAPAKKP